MSLCPCISYTNLIMYRDWINVAIEVHTDCFPSFLWFAYRKLSPVIFPKLLGKLRYSSWSHQDVERRKSRSEDSPKKKQMFLGTVSNLRVTYGSSENVKRERHFPGTQNTYGSHWNIQQLQLLRHTNFRNLCPLPFRHMGCFPDHSPFCWQVLFSLPLRTYELLQ